MAIEAQADNSEEQRTSLFISYSREDKDFVRRLDAALTQRDRETWVDLEEIRPTEEWLAGVYAGIEGSNAFLFVISPESVELKGCLQELAHAVEHNKRLVPIVRQDVDDEAVPESLRSPQWIFFRVGDDFEEAFQELVDALDTDLDWVHAHTRLLTRAIEWDNNGRDNSFVLRGSDLQTAEEWQVRAADKEPKLTALQSEYILAGRRAATRRQRTTLGAVLVGLVVAVALGSLALWQRNVAEDQRNKAIDQRHVAERQAKIALSRQLAAQSELVRNQQTGGSVPRSVLLTVEAMRRFPSLEADQTLRKGLALLPRPVSTVSHNNAIWDVDFSPGGQYVATASSDDTARVWDAETGQQVARLEHDDIVHDVAIGADGRYVATASSDGTAKVWDVQSGKPVSYVEHQGAVYNVDFGADGRYVASADTDGSAWVWEAETGERVAHLQDEGPIYDVEFSSDGKYVATASEDGTARVWEAETGEEVAQMQHKDRVNALAFGPDGRYVATASLDGTARVWEAETGKEVSQMQLTSSVDDVEFSPDGRYVATASEDGTARVWEAETGEEVAQVQHERAVRDIKFDSEGKYLATASEDGTTRIWYWRPEDLIEEACSRLRRNLTRDEWRLYMGTEPYRKTCPSLPEGTSRDVRVAVSD